jgi:hypothetical protein
MDYSRIFGSNFPDELIPYGTKKDIDTYSKSLITQYYSFVESGDISGANALYASNKDLLEPYMIDMAYINRLEEEIYNLGLAVLKSTGTVIDTTEPLDQSSGSFWYKEY